MDKEYIEEITITNAASNFPGIDVSAVCDYMTRRPPEIKYGELKPMTNADRIRSMSDEELADWVWGAETAGRAYGPRGKKAWLDWLKEEAHDEIY